MNVKVQNNVLQISGCRELTAVTAAALRDQVHPVLAQCTVVEIDLSDVNSMDCGGLGALVALRNALGSRPGMVRLINPTVVAERIFEAVCVSHLFEIVRRHVESFDPAGSDLSYAERTSSGPAFWKAP